MTFERVLVVMMARSGQWPSDTLLCAPAQDPVPQTVSAVHAAFDSLMDVLEAQQALAERARGGRPYPAAGAAAAAMGGQSALAFQEAVAAELMALGAQAITIRMSSAFRMQGLGSACSCEDLCGGAHAHRTIFAHQALSASLCDAYSAVDALVFPAWLIRTCLMARRTSQGALRTAARADVTAGS